MHIVKAAPEDKLHLYNGLLIQSPPCIFELYRGAYCNVHVKILSLDLMSFCLIKQSILIKHCGVF